MATYSAYRMAVVVAAVFLGSAVSSHSETALIDVERLIQQKFADYGRGVTKFGTYDVKVRFDGAAAIFKVRQHATSRGAGAYRSVRSLTLARVALADLDRRVAVTRPPTGKTIRLACRRPGCIRTTVVSGDRSAPDRQTAERLSREVIESSKAEVLRGTADLLELPMHTELQTHTVVEALRQAIALAGADG